MGTRTLARLAAAAGGATLALAAAPALADSHHPVSINPGNVPTTAADFENQECDGPLADLADDQDGWHLQLGAGGDNFTSLTLTYETPGGATVVVDVDSTDPGAPSESAPGDPAWYGFIGEPHDAHAWVVTEAGWTLVAGEATVDVPGQQSQFQLSHTCAGEPGNGGTPPPTTPPATGSPSPSAPPTESESTPPGETPGDDDDEEPALPVTGAQVGGLVALGGGLLAAGLALMAVRRRRNLADLLDG